MKRIVLGVLAVLAVLISTASSGVWDTPDPVSASGISMQSVKLTSVKDGMSLEQWNIKQRYLHDNKPDALKYVYIVGQNGQVTLNFQILGKVTSSGKRLTPRTVAAGDCVGSCAGIDINIGSSRYDTQEVIEDDGTYGDSMPYYYMWTTAGNYVQIIPSGMFLTVIADKPLTPTELVFSNTNVKN